MTKQRAAILEVLRTEGRHYTAEEIFDLAKLRLPTISRATVYNNLHALEGEKMIRRLGGEGASARYDSSFVPHGHLFCTECGGIFDFTIPDFNEELSRFANCTVDSYELKIRGVCTECKTGKQRVASGE